MTNVPIRNFSNIVPPTIALPTHIVKPGYKLYEMGCEANFLYLLKSGVLKAVLSGYVGSEQIADLYGPGDILGFAALNGGQHAETAIALQTSYVTPFERRYALKDTKLSRYLIQNLAQQLRRSRETIAVSELPVAARIAHLLLVLSKRFGHITGSGNVELSLPLTQEEIASLIHSSRVTVTRVLGELRNEGALKGSRGDYATNPTLLEAAADQYVLQSL